MIKANMKLDFKNNNEVTFDQPIQLLLTKLGHYATSINPYQTIGNNINPGVNTNVTLVATENNIWKNNIAPKLHQQFAQPWPEKLLKLINSDDISWQSDEELKN